MGEKLDLDLIFQVCVVVSDAKAVVKNWIDNFNIDESKIIHRNLKEMYDEGNYHCGNYNENPCEYYHELYRLEVGGIDFEIIEPITKEPGNPYTDFLIGNGGNGIHHLGVKFRDRDKAVNKFKEMGIPVYTYAYQGKPTDSGTLKDCYFYDLRKLLGVIFECGSAVVGPLANDPRANNPKDFDDSKYTSTPVKLD